MDRDACVKLRRTTVSLQLDKNINNLLCVCVSVCVQGTRQHVFMLVAAERSLFEVSQDG